MDVPPLTGGSEFDQRHHQQAHSQHRYCYRAIPGTRLDGGYRVDARKTPVSGCEVGGGASLLAFEPDFGALGKVREQPRA